MRLAEPGGLTASFVQEMRTNCLENALYQWQQVEKKTKKGVDKRHCGMHWSTYQQRMSDTDGAMFSSTIQENDMTDDN